ncbi:hypothetical protein F4553_007354 [Allocatelliglobosispora scoriae]|uniref:Uncharacterized protein n=1 Tax=Allocatelliglobosispora scoriae TaxID=643052 RepID=A0A841C4M7_9ACTN|nr:hypothetical protein [Allocatelliglobosispora scoriae]MBB5873920.1 hypothetical protein [Allocatelliglobosispora scoriae]
MRFFTDFMITGVLQVTAIWSALIAVAAIACLLILRPVHTHTASLDEARAQARARLRLRRQVKDLSRYAEEVHVAADRATVMADRFRSRWLAAHDMVERAFDRAEHANAAERRLAVAALLPLPEPTEDPAELADRARFLRRAVMASCARNELPLFELSEALAHRNGWDPARHPVEQELAVQRAVLAAMESEHAAALARERELWEQAQAALAQARSLRGEAAAAALRCGRQRDRLAESTRPRRIARKAAIRAAAPVAARPAEQRPAEWRARWNGPTTVMRVISSRTA